MSIRGPSDLVKAECTACDHSELIPAIGLPQGMRLPPYTGVLDLESPSCGAENATPRGRRQCRL